MQKLCELFSVLIALLVTSTVHCQISFQRNERAALAVYYRQQLNLLGNYTVSSVRDIFANILNDSETRSRQFEPDIHPYLQMFREFNAKADRIREHTALHEIDVPSLVMDFIEIHSSLNHSSSQTLEFFDRKFMEFGMVERYQSFMQKYRQFYEVFMFEHLSKYLESMKKHEETELRQWRVRLIMALDEDKRLEIFGTFLEVFAIN